MEMIKEIKKQECDFCNENKPELFDIEIHHPFNIEPEFSGKICDTCHGDSYAFCELCHREIFHTNGMRINLRFNPKTQGFECVSCLQKHWFENGMEKFDDGDFINDSNLTINGFDRYISLFLRSKESIEKAKIRFNNLRSSGLLVIVCIESSGMGFEYHIAIWIKEKNEVVNKL